MSERIRYSSTTLACPEPTVLAAFYADLTGGEVTFSHGEEWATVRCDGGRLEFMGVRDYQAPRWPEDSALVHIDFFVDDLDEAGARAVRAGARRFDHQPNPAHCLVLADPAGHPFCLSLIDEVG
ncbi:VOC family protein [Cellulomonas shaoxiangyii]|uniref:VOC family protein n=1 Tax=Cellulomonas shaoxiangyii TaxID=2566013 RepID=A0A4V1CMA3_9CELL|nr:VOC family protein [Cellulomonas shaoxiangyii]QCB92245.1 VOC family protein [Cellulomonas shaoxiangyii]TGY85943.1 VOC family protein [Cellulomonas shaoxiangyii]